MHMHIDETRQGAGATRVYPPVAGLAIYIRSRLQSSNQAVAQDQRASGDKSVLLPDTAVFDQSAGHGLNHSIARDLNWHIILV